MRDSLAWCRDVRSLVVPVASGWKIFGARENLIVRMTMGKFGRDQQVARNIRQFDNRTVCRVRGGQLLSIICAAVALAVACAPDSKAQTILGPSVSLASLTNSGADLIVGDKEFDNFSISGDYQASQVNVTPIQENGDYGIRFSGGFVAGGQTEDLILGYQVSVTNSPDEISAANLLFNGAVTFGTGLAEVVEQVFTNNPPAFYGQMAVFATATTNQLSTSLPIIPPQTFLSINKDVELTAQLPAFSSISIIDQTYTQVPEPSTLALAVAGLSGLFLLRRRKH
jgi:hypothetical protein